MGDKILELPWYMALRGDGAESVFSTKNCWANLKLSTWPVVRVQYEIELNWLLNENKQATLLSVGREKS